jgi:hypothetical protein
VHCTREEHAGHLEPTAADPPTFAHRLEGECGCGTTHGHITSTTTPTASSPAGTRRNRATYSNWVYEDERGNPLHRTVRQDGPDGKRYWQEHLENDRWEKGLGSRRVLYRLPDLALARTVHVVEGEKCADAPAELGFVATTNPMGASKGKSKWEPEYADQLPNAQEVIVWPDCDEVGRNHGEKVARSFEGRAVVQIVEIESHREDGYDVFDMLESGRRNGTADDLRGWITAIEQAAPVRPP